MKARDHPCSDIDGESEPRTSYRTPILLVDHDDVHRCVIDLQYIHRAFGLQR
jgi:hypothetical protein